MISRCASTRLLSALVVLPLVASAGNAMDSRGPDVSITSLKSWRDISSPKELADGANYYTARFDSGSTVHVVSVDLKKKLLRVRPFVSATTRSTGQIAQEVGALAAVNGGYFNLSNGYGASYVILDGKLICDPRTNKALVENPRLKPFLETIFSKRSEIRFLRDKSGTTTISIAPHEAPLPKELILVDSLQAGPGLLPMLRAEEEAFVRTESDGKKADSIGCCKPAARTAFGVTKDGHALFVTVAGKGQEPESSGFTLVELADLLKRLGCEQAINLDGGASTTMFVNLKEGGPQVVCGKTPPTQVKSVLLLEKLK